MLVWSKISRGCLQVGLAMLIASVVLGGCGDSGSESGSGAVGAADSDAAALEWDPVAGAIGYRIYYGTTQGGPYFQSPGNGVSVGNITTFTVTGLRRATRYFFVATALDATSESAFSNEVSKALR
jgi:hypothetical protein